MNRTLIPVVLLASLQFGCTQQYVYQEPAPVTRGKVHPVTPPPVEETVEVFKYPEAPEITLQPDIPSAPPAAGNQDLTAPEQLAPTPTAPPGPTAATVSPAILALAAEAEQSERAGNLDSAAAKIERALRIDTRNATLTYKLAAIRLKQEQPRLAEDLAKKADLLAQRDAALKKRCWLLIAEAKRMQNDIEGAQQAEQKAAQF